MQEYYFRSDYKEDVIAAELCMYHRKNEKSILECIFLHFLENTCDLSYHTPEKQNFGTRLGLDMRIIAGYAR